MKNVSCFKLCIDRSRAPKKMGTFKDISLFGNFLFPLEGDYAGGIIARSLAGVGREVKKTKAQLLKISLRNAPMAGSTGSSISSELPPAREGELQAHRTEEEAYSIRFINHAPEPLQIPSFIENGRTESSIQPSSGFALKKASRKRVVFSLEQKEIMIAFYNRQASTGIRAEPKEVIVCMQAKGVEALKETQIISWWSAYHQKRKRLLTAEVDYLRGLHPSACISASTVPVQPTPAQAPGNTVPVQQSTPAQAPGNTVPVQQSTPAQAPGNTVPVQGTTPAQTPGNTVPVQGTTPAQAPGPTVPVRQTPGSTVPVQPSATLTGYGVSGLADILQWTFPASFCQSTLGGRSGSNACTFIALYFGHLYLRNNLPPPVHSSLSMEWKCALYKAIKKGNEIHDELFEGEGVDVSVEDAVDMAGTECFVQSIGQSFDVFGVDCVDQLAEVFQALSTSSTLQSSCSVVVTTGRSFMFIVNQDGSCMVVDSHRHGNMGAIISYCPPNYAKILAKWLEAVMQGTWQCNLRVCSVTPIFYSTP